MNRQINITIPQEWFDQLQREARTQSVKEDKTITYIELIRETLKEKYKLGEIKK